VPRAKQRTSELRGLIVDAALSTLAEAGPAGFTTRRVAESASTSVPAIYELFGDKSGLVRELFFEGFRRLGAELGSLSETDDPRADLERVAVAFRRFTRRNPHLAQVMFSRPFVDFDPGRHDIVGPSVRELIVAKVQRAIDAGVVVGNPTDIAHVLLALAQGLALQESAGWLGTSAASRNRRWSLAVAALLDGLAPEA
jgi:AcrR family transcriptional regulator